jgi:hypothetical protein
MTQLIQYVNGERRVVDTENLVASEFLAADDLGSPLGDYDLSCPISSDDLAAEHRVLRTL